MNSKEIKALIADAQKWQGWRVVEIKAGWILYPPDKSIPGITVHKTPSDHRAWKNTRSLLRRAGAPVT
ncbi:MAG: hypothetical protein QM718_05040 [Steroidobacteraceae bacterium]